MATMRGLDEKLAALTADDLVSVYVGKVGKCACGCSGRHTYLNAQEGSDSRGYEVDAKDVSKKRIAAVLSTIQEHAADAVWDAGRGGGIWSFEDATKMWVAYVR